MKILMRSLLIFMLLASLVACNQKTDISSNGNVSEKADITRLISGQYYIYLLMKETKQAGYIHLAFSVGSRMQVDALTDRLREDGYDILSN